MRTMAILFLTLLFSVILQPIVEPEPPPPGVPELLDENGRWIKRTWYRESPPVEVPEVNE